MSNDIWVVAELENGQPRKLALELLSKAAELAGALGGRTAAVAVGPRAAEAVAALGRYGAQRIFVGETEALANLTPVATGEVVAGLVAEHQPRLVLIGATPAGHEVAAAVSAANEAGIIYDVTALDIEGGQVIATSPAFGGGLFVKSTFTEKAACGVALCTPNAFAAQPAEVTPEVVTVPVAAPDAARQAVIVDRIVEKAGVPNLEEAGIIVTGGRGLGTPEGFAMLRDLATALGGAVGATRPVVDSGWISYPHQVGQTGKTVKPNLYVACGVSGAIQHKVGMQTANVIVAINRDAEAPIFGFSDLCVVGDVAQIVPRLTELLGQ